MIMNDTPEELPSPITREEAKAKGLKPLTLGYQLPRERRKLDGAVSSLAQSNIEFALVPNKAGTRIELWRHGGIGLELVEAQADEPTTEPAVEQCQAASA